MVNKKKFKYPYMLSKLQARKMN